ncbi:MAG: glycosyltransferase family 4 protein [Bryobacteraceae bacterium]|jgi:glycosyltransferase involved in cell wall biosynthesis
MSSETQQLPSGQPETMRSYHPEWREVRLLDSLDLEGLVPPEGGLYSNQSWDDSKFAQQVQQVRRTAWLAAVAQRVRRLWLLGAAAAAASDVWLAWRLWRLSRRERSCGLIAYERASLLFLILRSWLPTRGRVVWMDLHLYPSSALKRRLLRRAAGAAEACVVWSRRSGLGYANELSLPVERFVVIPYQVNHSKDPEEEQLLRGDYVFAGGDSERDYKTLFQAVEGLDIAVVLSTTDPALTAGDVPRNVVVVQAREPHFRRLLAGARLVVVPLVGRRIRGGGEGTFLNAMWHRLAVVCADDVAAPEYFENGVDGLVVPPGDVDALRAAIRSLWDDPEKARRMGLKARAKVESCHSHDLFCERLVKLGSLLARGGNLPES